MSLIRGRLSCIDDYAIFLTVTALMSRHQTVNHAPYPEFL